MIRAARLLFINIEDELRHKLLVAVEESRGVVPSVLNNLAIDGEIHQAEASYRSRPIIAK